MTEFDDAILPDDFESPPQETEATEQFEGFETQEDSFEPVEDTIPTEQTIDTTPQTIKLKYNHEEREIPYDEAIRLAQMGMNYPKLQERLQALESDPRLKFVESLAQEQGMSVDEYLVAVEQYKEQERLNQLIQQNIPEELAQEILETRKEREQRKREQEEAQKKEAENRQYLDFFAYFKQANGRDYDADKDTLPVEVWEATKNGVPLKYAYMEHYNNQLQSQMRVLKQNQENTKRAPIAGIAAHGSQEVASEDEFLRGFNSI